MTSIDRADCTCGHPYHAHVRDLGARAGRRTCDHPGCGCPIWRDSGMRTAGPRRATLPDPVDHHAGLAPGEVGPVIHRDPSSPLFGGRPSVTRAIGLPTPEMLADAAEPPEPAACGAETIGCRCTLPARHRGPHVSLDAEGNVRHAWARTGQVIPAVTPDADREWIAELMRADGQIRDLVQALVEIRDHGETVDAVRELAAAALRRRFSRSQ